MSQVCRVFKKNVALGSVVGSEEVEVDFLLIKTIQNFVEAWSGYTPKKIGEILTRAIPAHYLSYPGEQLSTSVTFHLPGGKQRIVIPLEITREKNSKTRLTLCPRRQIKLVPAGH